MRGSPDSSGDMQDEHSLDDPLLAAVFGELRSWGEEPAPVPSEALAALLEGDVAPMPQPRRKRMLVSELLAGLGTKAAALGLAAKAALGVTVAAAAVTTAGAAGVLPDAAQHAVATAVQAVTPLQLPDPVSNTSVGTQGSTTPGDDESDDADDDGAGDAVGGQPDNHGVCVSATAKDGSLTGRDHGKAVSEIARSDCGKKAASSTTTTSVTSSTSTSSTTSTTPTTVAAANASRGNSGNGNSGSGNGNAGSGNGNSGNGGGNSGNGNGNGNSGRS